MANVQKFVDRMVYWCQNGNLGYDQNQRWNIYPGGECDCSSLVIHALKEAGFDTGNATYTGNLSAALVARGWQRIIPNGKPQVGDILLNDVHHVAAFVGNGRLAQASIDERGRASGGQAGDQANETNVKAYYNYPWNAYLRYVGSQAAYGPNQSSSPNLNPNNYSDDYVHDIQAYLVKAGFSVGPSGVDGSLGNDTFNAIKAYQKAKGLTVDGIPGPETLKALQGTSAAKTDIVKLQAAVRATQDNVAGPDTRKRIDAVRKASWWGGHSYPYGISYAQSVVGTTPDGYWGANSNAAHDKTVIAIQKAVGAEPDGLWGVETETKVNHALATAEQP